MEEKIISVKDLLNTIVESYPPKTSIKAICEDIGISHRTYYNIMEDDFPAGKSVRRTLKAFLKSKNYKFTFEEIPNDRKNIKIKDGSMIDIQTNTGNVAGRDQQITYDEVEHLREVNVLLKENAKLKEELRELEKKLRRNK